MVDPDDNRLIGYHGIMIGEGSLRRSGDPATVALTSTQAGSNMGDRLLPASVDVPLNFFPRSPSSNIDGRIIHVVGGVTQIGQYQVVVMNRGSGNGLSVGDVLSVFQAGEVIKDRVQVATGQTAGRGSGHGHGVQDLRPHQLRPGNGSDGRHSSSRRGSQPDLTHNSILTKTAPLAPFFFAPNARAIDSLIMLRGVIMTVNSFRADDAASDWLTLAQAY